MLGRFDPRAAWAAFSAEEQRAFGETALLLVVASDANTDCDSPSHVRWEHAEQQAWLQLGCLVPDFRDYPGGPDLSAIGVRACRECGCTNESSCPEGCWWVWDDLCSSCWDDLCSSCATPEKGE